MYFQWTSRITDLDGEHARLGPGRFRYEAKHRVCSSRNKFTLTIPKMDAAGPCASSRMLTHGQRPSKSRRFSLNELSYLFTTHINVLATATSWYHRKIKFTVSIQPTFSCPIKGYKVYHHFPLQTAIGKLNTYCDHRLIAFNDIVRVFYY